MVEVRAKYGPWSGGEQDPESSGEPRRLERTEISLHPAQRKWTTASVGFGTRIDLGLRLHSFDGLTMDPLAHLYKTLCRREARQEVLASTENLLREEGGMSPSVIASVIRQARSQIQGNDHAPLG